MSGHLEAPRRPVVLRPGEVTADVFEQVVVRAPVPEREPDLNAAVDRPDNSCHPRTVVLLRGLRRMHDLCWVKPTRLVRSSAPTPSAELSLLHRRLLVASAGRPIEDAWLRRVQRTGLRIACCRL